MKKFLLVFATTSAVLGGFVGTLQTPLAYPQDVRIRPLWCRAYVWDVTRYTYAPDTVRASFEGEFENTTGRVIAEVRFSIQVMLWDAQKRLPYVGGQAPSSVSNIPPGRWKWSTKQLLFDGVNGQFFPARSYDCRDTVTYVVD